MTKRIFTFIFAAYFIVLGLSPLWGFHGHNRDDSQIIHSHEQTAARNNHSLEKQTFYCSEEKHSHAQDIPVSVFEYLFEDKIYLDISITNIVDIKYLSISIIDIQKNLSATPNIDKFPFNFQTTRPVSRLISNSISSRAPPGIS